MALLLGIITGVLTAWVLYKILFGSFSDLKEAFVFWFQPDLVSIIFNELKSDLIAEFKIWVWLGCSISVGTFFYSLCK